MGKCRIYIEFPRIDDHVNSVVHPWPANVIFSGKLDSIVTNIFLIHLSSHVSYIIKPCKIWKCSSISSPFLLMWRVKVQLYPLLGSCVRRHCTVFLLILPTQSATSLTWQFFLSHEYHSHFRAHKEFSNYPYLKI